MTLTVFAALVVGIALGVAIGWLANANRSAAQLAQARAEAGALRESADLVRQSISAATEDAARRQSSAIGAQVAHIVDPLRPVLAQLADEVRRTEHHRAGAYAGLSEQVRSMHEASLRLDDQTRRLTNALHTPHIRGRWGEMQLERVVELAGMSRHCDFTPQVSGSTADGGVRPDLVVHLAGGRSIVVDAKAPLHAYLAAAAADDPAAREQHHLAHARALRAHVTSLAAKSYWQAFTDTPEMVVLFLPGDPILEAAVRADPELLELGFAKKVVIATPATLVALLRTVALGWRHDSMARDAAVIHELGTELHHRLGTVFTHLDRLGGSLRKAVESFNSTLGAVDARVGVTARKLAELEALDGVDDHTTPSPLDVTVRNASVPVGGHSAADRVR